MGGFNVGAAGAAASGFQQGLANFQDRQAQQQERAQRMSLADVDLKRQQRLQAREDEAMADENMANQAGMRRLEEIRKEYESQSAMERRTLQGAQAPGAEPAPWQPSKRDLLAAQQASYDELMKRGKFQPAMQRYAQTEAMRSQLREKSGKEVLVAMQSGGDVTKALQDLDSLNDDGHELLEAMPIKGKDGTVQAYRMRRKNRITGEADEPMDMPVQALQAAISMAMSSPKEIGVRNWQSYLDARKTDREEAKDERRGEREAANKRADAAREDAKQKAITARQEAHDQSVANKGLAAARITANAPFTLGEGQTRFTTGKDGKPVEVAAGKPKAGAEGKRDQVFDQIHDEIIRAAGELSQGLMGGNKVGSERTNAAANYAQALIKANPDMSVGEATRMAIAEMKKRQPAK